ncbi:MAG: PepSY domain-containing protein [Cyanobacteriota bacterium]|nr:PepSY domain-containing protein [Cyanobacteriota bacterium]
MSPPLSLFKRYPRQLHRALAPVMLFPLALTLTTGVLFHIAALTGNEANYLWLLALHRGRFGTVNLELIYVFLNGSGLFFLLATGLVLWFQSGRRSKSKLKR